MTRMVVVVGIVAGLVVACWKPFAPPRPAQRAFEPRIHMVQLANGLRVVALPDASATEVQVTLQVGAGSIDDPPGREGLAHLVEHLTYQQVAGGDSLYAQLERRATWFNGATEFEDTTFSARAAPADLERFLAVEAARLAARCEALDEAAFMREREVVRNELRQKAAPLATIAAIHAGLFPAGHPYAASTDSPETVGAITRDEACSFIAAHYAPDNAVLVVSGHLTAAEIERAARRAFEALSRRTRRARPPLPPSAPRTLERAVPMDSPAVVYGWPLPADPVGRSRVRALMSILSDHVNGELHGAVQVMEYGSDRALVIALAAVPAPDESLAEVRTAIDREIDELPTSFDNLKFYDDSFDHAQRSELARLYATLEDGGGRDAHVAAHALAGRDPARAVAEELAALADLDREAGTRLARAALGRRSASVVVLQPESGHRSGRPVALGAVTHDPGPRRLQEDPADAERPAPTPAPIAPPVITTRVLPTGIRAVLLPAPGSPTVDVRVVFAAGSADEPAHVRGVSALAAYALVPEAIDIADFIRFYEVGGTLQRRVGLDATTFGARGLARDFDRLLVGIERLLRNGSYTAAPELIGRMRALSVVRDPDTAIDAAWRTARHGAGHPYTAAGVMREASFGALGAPAAASFRAGRYRPDAMTIIIAGGFEPALADAWIDHQFATWGADGEPPSRPRAQARVQPTALAVHEATELVALDIALPAAGDRAALLVAAELIDQTVSDVRHQLGAAYSLSAAALEARLSSEIRISGHVDAGRAEAATTLVLEGLAALREPDAATAARFVAARRRVAARLRSIETSSASLADLAERDAIAGRPAGSDLQLAERVRKLTLRDLAPLLEGLELPRAALRVRGPEAAVAAVYQRLGLKPRVIDLIR